MFFNFKQAVSWNQLTMANESHYESDLVCILIDLNRCNFFKKNESRKNWASEQWLSRTKRASEPRFSCTKRVTGL